jgi:hypothetical protein
VPDSSDPAGARRDSSRLTRIIAIIGAVTGIFGAVVGAANYINARRVDLRISPVAYSPVHPSVPQPIPLGIVNRGERATSVTEGEVMLDGFRRGRVDRLLLDARVLDQPHSRRQLRSLSVPLPTDLPAGRSFAAAVTWDFSGPDYGDVWRKSFRHLSRRALGRHDVKVRLKLDPGGWRTVTVPLTPPIGSEYDLFRFRAGWYVQLGVDRGRVSELVVTSDFDDPAVVDLKLWRNSARRPALTFSTPIPTDFNSIPRGDLRPGRYRFALTSGGRVVAAATFETPCRLPRRRGPVVNLDACYLK